MAAMSLLTLVLLGLYVLLDHNKVEGAGWVLLAACVALAYGAYNDLQRLLGRDK